MDERVRFMLTSSFLAVVIFVLGVYTGVNISSEKAKDMFQTFIAKTSCEYAYLDSMSFEKALSLFRRYLPYRLEEGNFELSVLIPYMDTEYEYYTHYIQYWKKCGLKAPILYFFRTDEESLDCGKKLDSLGEKAYVFAFVDVNSDTTNLIKKYYEINETPFLIICDKYRVKCGDLNEIREYLEKC